MSRASKIFLVSSIAATTFTVWGVHYLQQRERDTMFAGVLRDDARQKAKKIEREARERDYEEQIRRRMYLESKQPVSNQSEGSNSASGETAAKLKLEPMDEVEFQGCKTC